MPASTATAAAILKEVYEGDIRKQLNSKTKLLQFIEKGPGSNRVGAKYITFPIHVSRNSGVGARKELETLPTAGNQGTTNARITLKSHYGAIQISGQGIELVDTDYNAFLDLIDLETNYMKDDLAIDYNRQLYGVGTGQVATTTTVGASTTPTIDSGLNKLQLNYVYDIITAADLAADNDNVKATVTITAIGTSTVTISSSVTFASGDVFVVQGNANRELTGLQSIIASSGTLHNIDPTTYAVWKSTVDNGSSSNRPLSEGLMVTMSDNIQIASGEAPTAAFCSLGVRRAYFSLLEQQRSVVNTTTFTGGFKGLAFTTDDGEIPIVPDKDCQANTMWFINGKHLKLYQDGDWSWMNRDGSMWYRLTDKDGYGARMYKYSDLATDKRNAHGKLGYITEG
jgi:hypothetical protein